MVQEENKIIKTIKFTKKNIQVEFFDGDSLKISESTFTHFYLYKDKSISPSEYQEIINYEQLNSSRQYILNLISRGSYTEKEIVSRLIEKKNLSYKDAKEIVNYLKEHSLIDDKNYLVEYVEILHNKNYGKNKILQKCFEKGFSNELIEKIIFDEEEEKTKATSILKKYILTKSKNYQKLKENAYAFLINQGFDFDICSNVIKIIDDMYDFSKEKELLHKDLEKYLRIHHTNLNDYDEKQKMINSFIRKGYKYEDIRNELKGVEEDEICK